MKSILLSVFFILSVALNAQVAINSDGSIPDNSAMLDVKSTNKGILVPRLTQAERDAITNPANGLLIYQTNNASGFYFNSGSSSSPVWILVGDGSFTLPYSASASSNTYLMNITNTYSSGQAGGIRGASESPSGSGVIGSATSVTGVNHGIWGESLSPEGVGVFGLGFTSSGENTGVYGFTNSSSGKGVYGKAIYSNGNAYGVVGESASSTGRGVYGKVTSTSGTNYGVYGETASSTGIGVYGFGKYGLQGETSDELGYGLNVKCTHTTGVTRGVNVSMSSPNGFAGYFAGGNRFVVTTADVGIGLVSPSRRLTIYTESGISSANFINGASGTTSGDGLMIGYSGGTFMGGANIMNYENDPLYLGTNGQPRITISSSGNVGIGTMFPDWQLIVQAPDNGSRPMIVCRNSDGNDRVQLRQTSNGSGAFYLYDGTNTNTVFLYGDGNSFINGGNLGIGTTAPAYKLQVGVAGDGTQARANAWNLLSDARFKKDLSTIDDPLGKVQKINGYYYYWNTGTDKSRQVGFSAQEMKEVLPEVVSQGEDGYLSIEYGKMAPLLIEAIKELKAENDQLRKDNENLNQKIVNIENKLKLRDEE